MYKNVGTHDIEAPSQVCVWGEGGSELRYWNALMYGSLRELSDRIRRFTRFCGSHMSHRASTHVH